MENPPAQPSSSEDSLLPTVQPKAYTEALDSAPLCVRKTSGKYSLNPVSKELPHRGVRSVPQNKVPEVEKLYD